MKTFGTKDNRLTDNARNLRTASTNVERLLWHRLRNRQLENCKFRRQHPIQGYILDFACEELKLGIELDGGQHNEQANQYYDRIRTEKLKAAGWHILRFWNNEVNENIEGVLISITETIQQITTA